jgi:adenylate cyclase
MTGAYIWAHRFDGTVDDIFELQEQVAESVVGAIAPKLEQAEIERIKRKPTANLDAYDCFLKGTAKVYEWTNAANDEALALFYRAMELDPDFAAPHAFATWCYSLRKDRGWTIDEERETAETARLARRAVELGKDDAFALCWAGYSLAYVVGELDYGVILIDRALQFNPNLARAWGLSGWVRIYAGQPEIAIGHLARAMRLSPLDPAFPILQLGTAYAHFFAGRYDEAASWAEKVAKEQPKYRDGLSLLAISHALAGQLVKAQEAKARLLQEYPAWREPGLKHRDGVLGRPEYYAKYLEGLRKAGLPE